MLKQNLQISYPDAISLERFFTAWRKAAAIRETDLISCWSGNDTGFTGIMRQFLETMALDLGLKRVSRLAANIPLIRGNLCSLSFVDVPERAYVEGMLGVYERNGIDLLRDVFVWAYERSYARYSAVRQSLGEPDPFRLHHRGLILETVADIVRAKINRTEAVARIKRLAAERVPEQGRKRFIEVVEPNHEPA